METLHSPPSRSDYIPLSEHQSQTPASFYDGPAILHHYSSSCTLKISAHDLEVASAFGGLANGAKRTSNGQVNGHTGGEEAQNGVGEDEGGDEEVRDEEVEICDIDVWVTSERFILFSPPQNSGVSIPYPSISLHAVQRPSPPSPSTPPALFLQLLPEANATFDDHDPDETVSLYIVPNLSASATRSAAAAPVAEEPGNPEPADEVGAIFAALSACANLHPDLPIDGDEEDENRDEDGGIRGQHPPIMFQGHAGEDVDGVYPLSTGSDGVGGLPPPMLGSAGWITAENVGDFFDEEGNWRGRGSGLGEGAGRVRGRDDIGEDGEGEGPGGEETKWSRTG